jgi:hypothetical protein
MKIKEGFELRTICGENIIISHGVENINFTQIITLNESATSVWNAIIGKEFDINDIVNVLTDEYEVNEEIAQKDAKELVESWKKIGLVG